MLAYSKVYWALYEHIFFRYYNRIDITLEQRLFKPFRLPLRYFDKRPVGELQTRFAELGNIRGFLTGSVLTLFLDSIFSVIYIVVMVIYSGVLTVVSLVVIPFI